jgi:hypothetical protein
VFVCMCVMGFGSEVETASVWCQLMRSSRPPAGGFNCVCMRPVAVPWSSISLQSICMLALLRSTFLQVL